MVGYFGSDVAGVGAGMFTTLSLAVLSRLAMGPIGEARLPGRERRAAARAVGVRDAKPHRESGWAPTPGQPARQRPPVYGSVVEQERFCLVSATFGIQNASGQAGGGTGNAGSANLRLESLLPSQSDDWPAASAAALRETNTARPGATRSGCDVTSN